MICVYFPDFCEMKASAQCAVKPWTTEDSLKQMTLPYTWTLRVENKVHIANVISERCNVCDNIRPDVCVLLVVLSFKN